MVLKEILKEELEFLIGNYLASSGGSSEGWGGGTEGNAGGGNG
jgi:hypothetical protein